MRRVRDQPESGISRYRDRHTLSGAKSDPGDAKMLAELVRTDRHNHRPGRRRHGDLAEGVKVLARAHQSLVWERTRATNRLRSSLREYFPAALDTFSELAERDTLAVLSKAAATPLRGSRSSRRARSAPCCVTRWSATQHRDPC